MKKLAKLKKRIRRVDATNAQLDGWLEELQNEVGSIREMVTNGVLGPRGPKGDRGKDGNLEGVAMLEELRQRVDRLETKQEIDHLNTLHSVQFARRAITRLAVATDEATQGGIKSFANRDRHAEAEEKAQWIEYPWKLDVDTESGKIERAVGSTNFVNELIDRIHAGEIKYSGLDPTDFLAYVDAVSSRKPKNPVATTADGKLYEPKGLNPIAHAEHARKTLGENVMVEYRQTGEHQAYFVKWEDVPDRVWVGKMWNRDAGWCKVGDEIYVRAGNTSNHAIWKAELDLEGFLKGLRVKFYVCFDQEFVDLGESAHSFPSWEDALQDDNHIGHTFNSYAGASTGWFVMNQQVWYLGADGKPKLSREFTGDWPVHKLAERKGRAFTSVPPTKPEDNPEMKLVFDRWTPTLKKNGPEAGPLPSKAERAVLPPFTADDGILDPKNPPPAGHSFVEMTTDELHARKLAEEPAQSRSLDDVEKAAADELSEDRHKFAFFELLAKRQDKRVRVYGRSSTDANQWAILVRSACETLGRPHSWGFDLLETTEPYSKGPQKIETTVRE